jgi:ABC-type transport system substrate-binding protein
LDYESDGSAAGDEFVANITASGLSGTSTDQDWIDIAESQNPLAVFNYTGYQSSTVEFCGLLLQSYLKGIGIKLNVLDPIPWDEWVVNYVENPIGHHRLDYSFGGWGPKYNDPINMIEPLYGTGASSNCFGLANATWNQMLIDSYSLTEYTTPTREEAFYRIQEEFCNYQIPTFYILQLGGYIGFNRAYIDEESVKDLKNIMGDLYWFNVKLNGTIESEPNPVPPPNNPFLIPGYDIWTLLGVSIGISMVFIIWMKRRIAFSK